MNIKVVYHEQTDDLISYIKEIVLAFVILTLPYIVGWGEFLV